MGADGLDAASATLLALAHVARLEVDALDEDLALGQGTWMTRLLARNRRASGLEALGAAGVALGQRLLVGRAIANDLGCTIARRGSRSLRAETIRMNFLSRSSRPGEDIRCRGSRHCC